MAGAAGFEPTNVGTKSRCLTTWRRPNILYSIRSSNYNLLLQTVIVVSVTDEIAYTAKKI